MFGKLVRACWPSELFLGRMRCCGVESGVDLHVMSFDRETQVPKDDSIHPNYEAPTMRQDFHRLLDA